MLRPARQTYSGELRFICHWEVSEADVLVVGMQVLLCSCILVLQQSCPASGLPGIAPLHAASTICLQVPEAEVACMPHVLQGVGAAKLAWKKKNAVPQTSKEARAARPTGRGDGGGRGQNAPNRGGGRGRAAPSELSTCRQQGLPVVERHAAVQVAGVAGPPLVSMAHASLNDAAAQVPDVEGLSLSGCGICQQWSQHVVIKRALGAWRVHCNGCVACQQWDHHMAAALTTTTWQ